LYVMLISRPPSSHLLPYTTLFRSTLTLGTLAFASCNSNTQETDTTANVDTELNTTAAVDSTLNDDKREFMTKAHSISTQQVELRSEEHTSELQSRENLVCRLLLEK